MNFKTSFGHGSLAQIPWLACFAVGQLASLEGVYPVLLYRRDLDSLTVAYGVSATAEKAEGDWPRAWSSAKTSGLAHFGHKKYSESYVFKEFPAIAAAHVDSVVAELGKVISDFLALIGQSAPLPSLQLEAIRALHLNLHASKLNVGPALVGRLLAAICAKPFCILTGLAGSGKTELAEALAIWLSESPAQYRLVAVGADWTNNEPLLGYADALHGALYRKPANGALDLLLAAAADPATRVRHQPL